MKKDIERIESNDFMNTSWNVKCVISDWLNEKN